MKRNKCRKITVPKKICIHLIIFSLFNSLFIGCYSSKQVQKEAFFSHIDSKPMDDDFIIITVMDERFQIKHDAFQIIRDTLFADGIKEESLHLIHTKVNVALDDIKYIEIDELDGTATTVCLIGSAGLFLIIASMSTVDKSATSCGYHDVSSNNNN